MRMNRNQFVVLWCAIALIAAMCLYVPWTMPAVVAGDTLWGGQPPDMA